MCCLTSGTEIHQVSLLHHSSTASHPAKTSAGPGAEAGENTAMAFCAGFKYLLLGKWGRKVQNMFS